MHCDELLDGERPDGVGHDVQGQVVKRAKAHARLADVHALAARAIRLLEVRPEFLAAVDPHEIDGQVVLLGGEGRVGERLAVVGIGAGLMTVRTAFIARRRSSGRLARYSATVVALLCIAAR